MFLDFDVGKKVVLMTNVNANLRKAAVLLRSVDSDTAATLLAQLSVEEAAALRDAVRSLGPLDLEEQADVAAEFRREKPLASEPASRGVELAISLDERAEQKSAKPSMPSDVPNSQMKRFEFLEVASVKTLAVRLSREHAQTIAVVLSHLPPVRAAAVLGELPEKTQAATMERLANCVDTDAEVVTVVERELAEWIKHRGRDASSRGRRRDAVSSILAAAEPKAREAILANLKVHNAALAGEIEPTPRDRRETSAQQSRRTTDNDEYRIVRSMARRNQVNQQLRSLMPSQPADSPRTGATQQSTAAAQQPISPPTLAPSRPALPRIEFDHLIHLDTRMLARLLAVADPTVLALALAGSNDELVDRVCDQMPKRIAKIFRREIRRMGPTRLSDVEAAQRVVAELAAQQIADRRAAVRQAV